jgi:hypothetical protein
MIISVINHTNGQISDEQLHEAIRAINRQLAEDYTPYWSIQARLRVEGESGDKPRKQNLVDMRGDAVLYLWDQVDVEDALGYHDTNHRGIPCGYVFTELSKKLKENWTVTLSHEALELVGDPEVNLLVAGPHPDPQEKGRTVYHWFEMCDAVQGEAYAIDGIEVSNFVLPLYFTSGEEKGGRNDFLGRSHRGNSLRSFGVNPGGYVGFFDPSTGKDADFSANERARKRLAVKRGAGRARRGTRYQQFTAKIKAR